MKNRYLTDIIEKHCFSKNKMAFLSGPRQSGKTVLSKLILNNRKSGKYYNWDNREFRRLWASKQSALVEELNYSTRPLLVLDEIHKNRRWKRDLKGLYDTLDNPLDILVTGNARLSAYNKGSDSLFGRYYHYRLHPFTLRELFFTEEVNPGKLEQELLETSNVTNEQSEAFDNLLEFSGFPEPYLAQNKQTLNLWQRTRQERVIREDLRDLSRLTELSNVELLIALLPERVGSPLKKQKLANLLDTSPGTIKRWLNYLKELYYLYEVKPYYQDIKSSIKKEAKLYLWDYSEIEKPAARFENMVANHLLKACHYWTDLGYGNFHLSYLKNKRQQEIDFLILKDRSPWLPIEVKMHDTELSTNWNKFLPQLKVKKGVQLTKKNNYVRNVNISEGQILISSAANFLMKLV